MAIKTAEVPTTEVVIVGYTCDCCGKKWDGNMWGEVQEMLHWENRGGYGSVFGDGTDMTLDLCQDCIKTRLGDCIQFHDNAYFPEPDDEPEDDHGDHADRP